MLLFCQNGNRKGGGGCRVSGRVSADDVVDNTIHVEGTATAAVVENNTNNKTRSNAGDDVTHTCTIIEFLYYTAAAVL